MQKSYNYQKAANAVHMEGETNEESQVLGMGDDILSDHDSLHGLS
jgi:hypothetical protein